MAANRVIRRKGYVVETKSKGKTCIPQFTCGEDSKAPVGIRCPTQHKINADVDMDMTRHYLRVQREVKEKVEKFLHTVQFVRPPIRWTVSGGKRQMRWEAF